MDDDDDDQQHYRDAFPTVFLPIELPFMPLAEKTGGVRNDRDSVLLCWKDFLAREDLEQPTLVDVASSFVDLHVGSTAFRPDRVKKSLTETKVGGYWGFHVRAQNAAVLIYRETNEKVLFMAWQVQAKNPDVINNVAIYQTVPEVSVKIKWENLLLGIETLCDLANREQQLAVPTTTKEGKKFQETREVNSAFFVLDVVVAALGAEVIPVKKYFKLNKKMHDEVRYSSSARPWRRDPIYAVIKSILHLVCWHETQSHLNYKVLMQRFLIYCLKNTGPNTGVTDSSLMEASRKIARRQAKLQEESSTADPLVLTALDAEIEMATRPSLENIDDDWGARCHAENSAKFDISLDIMKRAIFHTLPHSGEVLAQLAATGGDISAGAVKVENLDVAPPKECDRLRNWSPLKVDDINRQIELLGDAATIQLGTAPHHFVGVVHDIAEGVVGAFDMPDNNIEIDDDPGAVAFALLHLEEKLINVGLGVGDENNASPFEDDVRSKSHIILAAFTICLLIDKLSCREYSLLSEHKLGVSVTGIFDRLFISSMKYRKHLHAVESYLQIRDAAQGLPPLESNRSAKSFSVRFAEKSESMEKIRATILKACKKQQESKEDEWRTKRGNYNMLMESSVRTPCSCFYDHRNNLQTCRSCGDKHTANNLSISLHEKYLPPTVSDQRAVVFELQMPDILDCQRECLAMFMDLVCEGKWHEETGWVAYWRNESSLSPWLRSLPADGRVKLGSTTKKVTRCHYGSSSKKIRDCRSTNDVVVDHGYRVISIGEGSCATGAGPMNAIRDWIWDMSKHTTMSVSPGRYHSLQPFFNSFSHSENTILALKSESSEELSLREFEEVGCLRAGPSMQLERMLTGLQQQVYSLDREEIVSLFCCVLWQVGPSTIANCFRPRRIDDCFRNCGTILNLKPVLSMNICRQLQATLRNCETNWSKHNILLTIVHIARHLLGHMVTNGNEDAMLCCVAVLRKCRLVAIDWLRTLSTALNECTDDKARQGFREKLVDIACIGTLTFLDCEALVETADDVHHWSYLRAVFHDNFVPNEILEPSRRRRHIFHCLSVAEQVAPRLLSLLETHEGKVGLSIFLSDYWTGSSQCQSQEGWRRYTGSLTWFYARFRRNDTGKITTIQFQVVSGSLLVDGDPCARLPKGICADETYRRFFANALFRVQPIERNAYRTAYPVNGFYFEFYSSSYNSALGLGSHPIIIKERVGLGEPERSVLVPDSLLAGDFPKILTCDYSHWFVIASNEKHSCNNLCFRPIKYTDPRLSLPLDKDDYVLQHQHNLQRQEKVLVELTSGACFLDIHGGPFQDLYSSVFCRMSPAEYVHIKVTSDKDPQVIVNLPRLDHLSFEYDGSSICTRQFGGLEVAQNQNSGIFIGLEHGLLLEDPKGLADKVFLCPHGAVSRVGNTISIDTEDARPSPYFKFHLRSELRDVKPAGSGRLGWLFLSLLHAHTGDLKPDPFSGCTGTQRALDILRRGYCQGNLVSSADEESLRAELIPEMNLLGDISKLSMARGNYHNMEQVKYGSHPALCAHDGFALVALQRIRHLAEELRLIGKEHVIHEDCVRLLKDSFQGRSGTLTERAYFRRRKYYPSDTQLIKAEELILSGTPDPVLIVSNNSSLGLGARNAIRELGITATNQGCPRFQRCCLVGLLGSNEELVGCATSDRKLGKVDNVAGYFDMLIKARNDAGSDQNESKKDKKVEFHDIWLHLYRLARTEYSRSQKSQVLFGYLLAFVAVHYPEAKDYLQELNLVVRNPTQFPQQLPHTSYFMTYEVDFTLSRVDELIDSHLDKFTKPAPQRPSRCSRHQTQEYERRYQRWTTEQEQHKQVNERTKSALQSRIKASFHSGHDASQIDRNLPQVTNKSDLVDKLQTLFSRWRGSQMLLQFSMEVEKQLDAIRKNMHWADTPSRLYHSEPRNWSKHASFKLQTQSTRPVQIDQRFWHFLKQISVSGKYSDAVEHLPEASSRSKQDSPFVYTPVDGEPSEADLCEKDATKLQVSVKEALKSPEQSYDFLQELDVMAQIREDLINYKNTAEDRMNEIWSLIKHAKKCSSSLLPAVGLWNSTAPWNVLSRHFKPSTLTSLKTDLDKDYNGFSESHLLNAFAVAVKHVQRARRCLSLLRKGEVAHPALARDIGSQGCAAWNPKQYPQFLAFELDNDLCIREEQASVALEILRVDLGNRLLQMNMGCGKSSVIMPLVLCVAAAGESVARATVLSSLYSTNASDWQSKVGGLLDRQIFPMICCRDMEVDAGKAGRLKNRLTTIRGGCHLIVTVPEHRLSLENKAVEACFNGEFEVGTLLLDTVHELAVKARDFVDESDEIASPKYQLVYPLGSPQDMDAAQTRWLLHAAALQSVSSHAEFLLEKYGHDVVEIVEMHSKSYEYNAIRLLDGPRANQAYEELCELVLDDIIDGKVPAQNSLKIMFKPDEKSVWKRCALGGEIHGDLASLNSKKLQQSALCLRGLLSHDILQLVLQKRFRVNYGSHPTRTQYQMAVPYRAKDIAAERTDFAHPDVCLSLTFATYYQSGLLEEQLLDVFERLSRMNDGAAQYDKWTAAMEDIDDLSSYDSINLQDPILFKNKIFPAFRKHFGVIDFWLRKVIFPAQARQYEMKLTSTPVDLFKSSNLSPACNAITTGFSGTDDLSRVLPPTVKQMNLEELAKTNGIQVLNILRPENDKYYCLEALDLSYKRSKHKSSTDQILDLLTSNKDEGRTNVVLDAGAQILHMSNEQFSRAWLIKRPDCEACVFFRKDRIVFVSRIDETRVIPFSGSQYELDMSRCLLYLDDEHTRGSDFKLPLNARALVTLGKGMNKDKFVQACMRMRQIGKGQQLCFVASHDVHLELQRLPLPMATEVARLSRILNWTLKNTARRICDLVPYFVNQALCSMRKSDALKQFYYKGGTTPAASDEDLANLAIACTETEQLTLEDMYLHPRGQKTLLDLTIDRLPEARTNPLAREVLHRVVNIAPFATRHCSLHEEEQEVEREQELDEERQVERPPPAKPLKSSVSPELIKYFHEFHPYRLTGTRPLGFPSASHPANVRRYFTDVIRLLPFSSCFAETQFAPEIGEQLDRSMVFVTSDFVKCVEGNADKTFYLKRFRWFERAECKGIKITLLISNFEAEAFFLQQSRRGSCFIESFVPAIKRKQLHFGETPAASLPSELQAFGGSINAEGLVMDRLKSFLGLHPSPTTGWSRLYERGEIESDGFVPLDKRELGHYGPFEKSPIQLLVRFLADARHLGSQLRTSELGQMIEICEEDLETNYQVEE